MVTGVTFHSPHQPKPPSKYLALWIAVPVIGVITLIAALLSDDNEKPSAPRRVEATQTTLPTTSAATPSPSMQPPATVAAEPTQPVATTTRVGPPTTPAAEPDYVYYRNCDAARAAGAAPLRRGEPGYRSALDRDGDGVACDKG